jgi:curved DNA-binding protein
MSVEFKDYYTTLGLSREATPDEIKKAFRKLARIHHPDVAKDKAASDAKFKEINEANEVLSDPVKRRKYDELGADWQAYEGAGASPPGGTRGPQGFRRRSHSAAGGAQGYEFNFGGSTGFSDFFEQYFGTRHGGGFAENPGMAGPQAGADTEADLMVSLEEALHGGERMIRLERMDPATGQATTRTIRLKIPPGVRDGQRLRTAGHGGEGHGGGPAGDLYLRVRLAAHPDYSVHGNDLHYELTLAPWEAVLGTTVAVPLPGGRQGKLKVPAGTGSGQQLRLRGLGLPNRDGTKGDLYAVVAIALPSILTDEERTLWEKLAATSNFKPRAES